MPETPLSVHTRLVALGSAFGDDRLGWRILEILEPELSARGVECRACLNPGGELLDMLAGMSRVILLDAVLSGAPPGSLHRYSGQALLGGRPTLSTHGLDLPTLLSLAKAMNCWPAELWFYGLELDPASLRTPPDAPFSPAVEQGIQTLAAELREILIRNE